MRKKLWLVDLGLMVLIIAMGIFVFLKLRQTAQSKHQQTNLSLNDPVALTSEKDVVIPTPEVSEEEAVIVEIEQADLFGLDGEPVALDDFSGKPMMVNFWATYCPPCLEEMPVIQDYAHRYENELVVLAINPGEEEHVVRNFVDQHGFELTFLLNPTNTIARQYRVFGFPTTLFFDERGEVVATHIGELDSELIDRYLLKLGLGE